MIPVELNGNLLKELRGRTCRILANEGWTQSNLGSALGVSQVMAGNYLHTLPTRYSEPTESNLQEASLSLAEILKSEESFSWSLKITANDHVISHCWNQFCSVTLDSGFQLAPFWCTQWSFRTFTIPCLVWFSLFTDLMAASRLTYLGRVLVVGPLHSCKMKFPRSENLILRVRCGLMYRHL